MNKSPYSIIKRRYVTEKSLCLEGLHQAQSNRSLKRCENPKVVFLVDIRANKQQIAKALEEIYAEKKIKVLAVNTSIIKPKAKRMRGRKGKTAAFKRAIVTLEKGDAIDDQV